MKNPLLLTSLLCTAALAGCIADDATDDDGLPDGPATSESLDDGKDDTAVAERVVRAGQLTLTMTSLATLTEVDGQPTLIAKGTTSRNIDSVFSFVPDDAYGEARLTGPRKFEVVLRGHSEINTVLSGLPLFVRIQTTTGTIRDYFAKVELGSKFARFTGTSRIHIDAVIHPVSVVDAKNPLRYRARIVTTSNATSLVGTTPEGADPTMAQLGPREFYASFDYDRFTQAFTPGTVPVTFTARFADGSTATKRAGIDLKVVRVGLTTEDPYDVWPAPECTDPMLDCLIDLPDSAVDWGTCGDYRATNVCRYQHLCEIAPPASFGIDAADSSGLASAIEGFNDACPSGGSWCHLDTITAYVVPACLAEPATIDQVVASVLATVQDGPMVGTVLDDAGLGETVLLGTSYSSAGPALSGSMDGWQGGTTAVGWDAREEVPCHNCTDFRVRTIVFYPSTGWVFLLEGSYGYDS